MSEPESGLGALDRALQPSKETAFVTVTGLGAQVVRWSTFVERARTVKSAAFKPLLFGEFGAVLLPDAELAEDTPQDFVAGDGAGHGTKSVETFAKVHGDELMFHACSVASRARSRLSKALVNSRGADAVDGTLSSSSEVLRRERSVSRPALSLRSLLWL